MELKHRLSSILSVSEVDSLRQINTLVIQIEQIKLSELDI